MNISWNTLAVLLLTVYPLLPQTAPGGSAILEWSSRFECGKQHYDRGELPAAEECFRAALLIAERLSAGDSRRGTTLSSLGTVLLEQGRLADADRATSAALDAFRECGAERCGPGLARAMHNLAIVYAQQNRRFEAEQLLRKALVLYARVQAGETGIAAVLDNLGWLELNRRRPGAAESYFRRALLLIRDIEGLDRIRGQLYASLSSALLELNRPREAAAAAQQALASASSVPGIDPLEIVGHACTLARASLELGDYALAERSLTRARQTLSQVPQAEPRELGVVLTELGRLRLFQKRFDEAAEYKRRALEILSHHLSADHPQMLKLKANYAALLRKLKRKQEAKRLEAELRAAARPRADDPEFRYSVSIADLQRRR